MYQINEANLERLMEASQKFHAELVKSAFWNLIRTEPVIMEWLQAMSAVESEIKKSNGSAT